MNKLSKLFISLSIAIISVIACAVMLVGLAEMLMWSFGTFGRPVTAFLFISALAVSILTAVVYSIISEKERNG